MNSKCTGFGTLTHKDGRRYEGQYVNDKMQGHGVYTWANGAKYDGEYKDNKKNGHGLHTWPDGSMYEGEYLEGMQTGQGYMAWGDGRVYRGAWVQSKCTGFGILTHADGRRYEGYYLKDKMHGHGVYMWPDGRKYNGEYKNNLKHGHGVWTWPDGVMLEGQWAENLPCRHACTIIFSSYVSTDEVQPRIGLDTDTTLHKLWEDAHAWRQEHNVVHSSRHRRDNAQTLLPSPRHGPVETNEHELSDVDEEVAPRGASVCSVLNNKPASKGAGAPPTPSDFIRGANSASVDVGRLLFVLSMFDLCCLLVFWSSLFALSRCLAFRTACGVGGGAVCATPEISRNACGNVFGCLKIDCFTSVSYSPRKVEKQPKNTFPQIFPI